MADEFFSGFPWVMAIWPLVNTSLRLALWGAGHQTTRGDDLHPVP